MKLTGILIVVAVIFSACHFVEAGNFRAGASKIDGTLPIGAPLAGYNHGDRRVPNWPLFQMTPFTSWMTPSQGIMNPTWIKALVVDSGNERVCFVSLDLMCADSSLALLAWAFASMQGFSIPMEKVTFSGSHTHSGPGGWVSQFAIQITPTMDLFVPQLQQQLARSIARAMVEAEKDLQPALVGIGMGILTNVTHNRRSGISPYVNSTTIDPNVGVLKIDKADGTPLATLWNFAVHGVCWGPDNMYYSSDIMGGANDNIEAQGGGIALFVNGDAGDISPNGDACAGKPDYAGGHTIANTVMQVRQNTTAVSSGEMFAGSTIVEMGQTLTNWTMARELNCTSGGPFDICSLCEKLDCTMDLRGGYAFVEEQPRFTAVRFNISGVNTLFVSIPGEAIVELGWQIRNDSLDLGFDQTFLFGYTNNYLMYFTTPNEYVLGGYEANLTLWGIDTAETIRGGCYKAAIQVAPPQYPRRFKPSSSIRNPNKASRIDDVDRA